MQEGSPAEGITIDMEKKLRGRKKITPGRSEEDRWRDIYTLIFPDEAVSMPCELSQHSYTLISIISMIVSQKISKTREKRSSDERKRF
jgi:hypothetical protein